jgi:hypothetical protein
MKRTIASIVVLVCLAAPNLRIAARQTSEWGSGVAPFAFALTGDMPYGAVRETPFARLVAEINRDNDVDFVMHAGDIKAGSERCDDALIRPARATRLPSLRILPKSGRRRVGTCSPCGHRGRRGILRVRRERDVPKSTP